MSTAKTLPPGAWITEADCRLEDFRAQLDQRPEPAHPHRMSATLTLQGAVAHCDMPLESGPTMLLPYSQHFAGGYVASSRRWTRTPRPRTSTPL